MERKTTWQENLFLIAVFLTTVLVLIIIFENTGALSVLNN